MFSINTICVCGAGTMGSGIALVTAQHGFTTIQFDVSETMCDKSRQSIDRNLQALVDKGKINASEKLDILGRIKFTTDIHECRADLIIEAIIENKEAKIDLFNKLAAINDDTTLFATNTSSISVNEIAAGTVCPSRVAGMHFFNPAPVMKLVEVIQAEQTDEEVKNAIVRIVTRMGKTPVVCKDVPGFIVNRVARHYYLEAMQLMESGAADAATIDKMMEASGFKMGPFRLMDLIGMDINFSVSKIVWEALGKPERLKPSIIQQKKVEAGELGRKTGKGFYQYS